MLPNDMERQRRSFKILFQEFIHFMIAKGKLKLKTLCIPFEKIQLNIKCGIRGPIYYYYFLKSESNKWIIMRIKACEK